MANTVGLKSIGSLLDGKNHFFIPAYQRGYRWRRKQVEELLSDLYSFTKRNDGDYYCLQPVIVKPIDKEDDRWKKVFGNKDMSEDTNLWELVDGQQRLTSILLILKSLLSDIDDEEDDEVEENKIVPYSVHYESRLDFIGKIVEFKPNKILEFKPQNIDEAHAAAAVRIINKWYGGKGIELSKIYLGGSGDKKFNIKYELRKLLTADTKSGIVNLIWYQLDPTTKTDTVKEFIRINNGKIPLSDSELVKALFLQHRNKIGQDEKEADMKRALSWEEMENRLQSNDFWGFVSPLDNNIEDRMSLLLEMIYRVETGLIKENIEKGDVFRFFYNSFEGKQNGELEQELNDKWNLVIDAFHALENWYESPLLYNYIGYLIGSGGSIADLYMAYKGYLKKSWNEDEVETNPNQDEIIENHHNTDKEPQTFEEFLEQQIKKTFENIKYKKDEEDNLLIDLPYSNSNRKTIENLLKFLNIHFLTEQFKKLIEKSENYINDAGVFRFPFNLYKEQGWDIEHIDSQTTNPLQSNIEKQQWILGSLLDTLVELKEEDKEKLTSQLKKLEENQENEMDWSVLKEYVSAELLSELNKKNVAGLDNAIRLIEDKEGTDRSDPHFIGNLTLLDALTNRSYKNAIFCTKRKHIIGAISKGRYVLPATQVVFMKFFDDATLSSTSRIKWTGTDMRKNHDFIYNQLKNFLPDAKQ